jgi:hypothetical protein
VLFRWARWQPTAALGFDRDRGKQSIKLGIVQVLQRAS